MKIILYEIKKIFNIKMLCIAAIISVLIYNIFTSFAIKYYPGGSSEVCEVNTLAKLIEENGSVMNEKSYNELVSIYKVKEGKADKFFKNNKIYNDLGIHSYKEYCGFDSKESADKLMDADSKAGNELNTALDNIGVIEELKECYENRNQNSQYIVGKRAENESIFSYIVMNNYNKLISGFGLSIVIGVAFMLLPVFLKDKKDKVYYLQYSSRRGRRIVKSKVIAGVVSAVLIATVELVICFALYSKNNTGVFFGSNLNSVFMNMYSASRYWISITFGQYIILTIACLYMISIITALMTMFVSYKANSYVAGIGIEAIILFVLFVFTNDSAFAAVDRLNVLTGVLLVNLFTMFRPKYISVVIFLFLILTSVAVTIFSYRREKVSDILN